MSYDRADRGLEALGRNFRRARFDAGLSQKELAEKVGVSASLISQFETGSTRPSAGTLFALVTELGVSLDRLIHGAAGESGRAQRSPTSSDRHGVVIVRPEQRRLVELSSGVRWEELAVRPGGDVDFFEVIYDAGAVSTEDDTFVQHAGREYACILSGKLNVQVGSDTYILKQGDSISFASDQPHLLWNDGSQPVHAIWLIYRRTQNRERLKERPSDPTEGSIDQAEP